MTRSCQITRADKMCDAKQFRFYSADAFFCELRTLWPLIYEVSPKCSKIAEDINSMKKSLQSSHFSFPR